MVPLTVLEGPRLKVERAYRHIDEIRTSTDPLSREWHTFGVERNGVVPYKNRVRYSLMYRPLKPISKMVALMIGDAAHNLRGALDHLCTGIVRTHNPAAEPHFPMRKNWEDLIPANGRGSSAAAFTAIEKALPGAKEMFFKEIRPRNGPNEALWAFHDLDNNDKHNLILPTVAVTKVSNINARLGGGGIMTNCSVGNDADSVFGAIVSWDPIAVDNDFQTATLVSFPQGGLFENEPVVPTLTQIAQVVTETINAFERLIRA